MNQMHQVHILLLPDARITNTPLGHSGKTINHLRDQVSLLRGQLKSKIQQKISLLEHASRRDHI